MCAILLLIFTSSNNSLPSPPLKTRLGRGYRSENGMTRLHLEAYISREIHLSSFLDKTLVKWDSSVNKQVNQGKSSHDQVSLRCRTSETHSKTCSATSLADKSRSRDEDRILTLWILVLALGASGLKISSQLCLHRTLDRSMAVKPTISLQILLDTCKR